MYPKQWGVFQAAPQESRTQGRGMAAPGTLLVEDDARGQRICSLLGFIFFFRNQIKYLSLTGVYFGP